ncbi:MAG: thioredoxin family protein [Bacteroidetes bacterium]|nr:thioredoxin family protein [Bacteroidota bacterium]
MKKSFFVAVIIFVSFSVFGQVKEVIYHPESNAETELSNAISKAKAENKNILVQVGGNWCKWCLRFNKFCHDTLAIDSAIKANYVVLHVNYSKENENFELLQKFDNPQRFGFPVLLILDSKGNRLHTQDSGFLESGEGYDKDKVLTFLKQWTFSAVNPKNYSPKYKK